MGKTYKLTFTVHFIGHVGGWSNIFRFTSGTHDLSSTAVGDRVFAVWMSNLDRPHICIERANSRNWNINPGKLIKGSKNNFEIHLDADG